MIRAMLRALWVLVAVVALVATACLEGCATVSKAVSPGATVATVAASILEDLRDARAIVCTPKLDALLGDPRGDLDASAGAPRDASVTADGDTSGGP